MQRYIALGSWADTTIGERLSELGQRQVTLLLRQLQNAARARIAQGVESNNITAGLAVWSYFMTIPVFVYRLDGAYSDVGDDDRVSM